MTYEGRFEIIFVNDASTDDSYKVLNKLKEQFPKVIKLIKSLKSIVADRYFI